jgi:basic membrane lipoprotein Med (substrate-binding protein (PBP1-ABC) superfamily)
VVAIGNVIDTREEYPGTVIASALWHMEPTIDRAIEAVKSGSFKAEDYGQFSYMAHGGNSLAPMDPALVGQDVIDTVEAMAEEIKSGKLAIEVDDSEPKSTL